MILMMLMMILATGSIPRGRPFNFTRGLLLLSTTAQGAAAVVGVRFAEKTLSVEDAAFLARLLPWVLFYALIPRNAPWFAKLGVVGIAVAKN
jgi:hypothetical protein